MSQRYIWEKLYEAVYCLIGTSSMAVRISAAYVTLATINENDIPEEIRGQFRDVMQLVRTAKSDTVGGRIKSAVRKMSKSERYDMAKIILGMFDIVTRNMPVH